ncbi:MAG: bifunctional 2-C-methyl-D-erythritol 4-phosphate cytidylyltransferase/2-C-methyl-D-erythritol 2,4-cyclodiphosphate synthase [Caulobacteraceae bacterium]|nr:bifunctional 2-C-methyl-D-erythritol 4-phosphate cytidylyltransferase/2-C-methyl-D-erythritol 2,4-cyclodiphosphate synthase [Caulobacter sp.]
MTSWGAVIVAAGAGLRAGGDLPKQWRTLAGKPVLRWSAEALLAAGAAELVVVTSPAAAPLAAEALDGLPRWRRVDGGAERIDSVRAGLAALAGTAPEAVLVHDAARPLVAAAHVEALLAALEHAEGALPALPVPDTIKRADAQGRVLATVDRADLYRAQTPQAFRYPALVAAYAAWPGGAATDDAAVVEAAGGRVALIPGDPRLIKLTYPEDFPMAEAYAAETAASPPPAGRTAFRTGTGVDAHTFGPGDHLMICGVSVPHDAGFIAHSDGDVGLHALTDALLGAMALGDIGDHFPPTDPQWKNAASDQFLLHALKLVGERGGRVVNADVTLICERPKVKPHREAMRARIAELLALPLDRVSVKATTMERMGFTGREEGMVAQAAVSVEAPA